MTETELPKHKPLRGKTQKNNIINRTHGLGANNPWNNPNYSKYELEL